MYQSISDKKKTNIELYIATQETHNLTATSLRRCNDVTLPQHCCDVVCLLGNPQFVVALFCHIHLVCPWNI